MIKHGVIYNKLCRDCGDPYVRCGKLIDARCVIYYGEDQPLLNTGKGDDLEYIIEQLSKTVDNLYRLIDAIELKFDQWKVSIDNLLIEKEEEINLLDDRITCIENNFCTLVSNCPTTARLWAVTKGLDEHVCEISTLCKNGGTTPLTVIYASSENMPLCSSSPNEYIPVKCESICNGYRVDVKVFLNPNLSNFGEVEFIVRNEPCCGNEVNTNPDWEDELQNGNRIIECSSSALTHIPSMNGQYAFKKQVDTNPNSLTFGEIRWVRSSIDDGLCYTPDPTPNWQDEYEGGNRVTDCSSSPTQYISHPQGEYAFKRQKDINTDSPTYNQTRWIRSVIDDGLCYTPDPTPNWQDEYEGGNRVTDCSSSPTQYISHPQGEYAFKRQKDINTDSPTYNQTRWIRSVIDDGLCYTPDTNPDWQDVIEDGERNINCSLSSTEYQPDESGKFAWKQQRDVNPNSPTFGTTRWIYAPQLNDHCDTVPPDPTPDWVDEGEIGCSTSASSYVPDEFGQYAWMKQRDINPNSPTYNQIKWRRSTINDGQCYQYTSFNYNLPQPIAKLIGQNIPTNYTYRARFSVQTSDSIYDVQTGYLPLTKNGNNELSLNTKQGTIIYSVPPLANITRITMYIEALDSSGILVEMFKDHSRIIRRFAVDGTVVGDLRNPSFNNLGMLFQAGNMSLTSEVTKTITDIYVEIALTDAFYNVTYNLVDGYHGSGSVAGTSGTYMEGETYTVDADKPYRDIIPTDPLIEDPFYGWKRSDNGNFLQKGDSFTMPANNVVLTSYWKNQRWEDVIEGGTPVIECSLTEGSFTQAAIGQYAFKKQVNNYEYSITYGEVRWVRVPEYDGQCVTPDNYVFQVATTTAEINCSDSTASVGITSTKNGVFQTYEVIDKPEWLTVTLGETRVDIMYVETPGENDVYQFKAASYKEEAICNTHQNEVNITSTKNGLNTTYETISKPVWTLVDTHPTKVVIHFTEDEAPDYYRFIADVQNVQANCHQLSDTVNIISTKNTLNQGFTVVSKPTWLNVLPFDNKITINYL